MLNCLLHFLWVHVYPSFYLRPTEEGVFRKKRGKLIQVESKMLAS